MSRCFPFPPPGYEKETRSGDNNGNLLRKEKHKEKKHKKEKRDREKREKKDKDRSKDKHKEKKDRKEKHKDKTKDKGRDKDKNKTPEDTRTEIRPEIRHENQFGYNCKAEEVQDTKFTAELGRRIRDEERGAADRIVGNFATTTQRSLEGVGISTAMEKESGNKVVTDFIERRNENLSRPIQKKPERMGTGFATAKQRAASSEKVPDFTSTGPGRNHVAGLQSANTTGASQIKTEGTFPANSLHKERGGSNSLSNSLQKERGGSNGITGMASGRRRTEGMLTPNSVQKERSGSNNVPVQQLENVIRSVQRSTFTANSPQKERAGSNNVPGRLLENVIGSVQRSTFTANSLQKERDASNNMVANFAGAAQKKTNGKGQQPQNLSSSIQRSTESIGLTPNLEKERVKDSERGPSNNMFSDFVGAAQSKNGRMGQQVGNLTPSIQRSAEGIDLAPKMEKELVKDIEMVPNPIGTEHKTDDWIGQPVEKLSEKKKERKEKSKEKKTERKGDEHKDRDRNEKKSKRKDKDRHKEKEKEEKKRGKSGDKHKKHYKLEEIRKNNQVHNITKSVAPQAENANTIAADGNVKKRKGIQINGFLLETDGRPNKLPRTSPSSSHTTVENGKTLESGHIPLPCSIKFDAVNKAKAEMPSDNKETVVNSKAGGHLSSVALRSPAPVASGESGLVSSTISLISHHPDATYLSTVYSVPKMDECPEFDDQEWLFSSKNQKPSAKLEDDAVPPQVWAKGLQIESAGVFALPYVIPF